MKCVSYDYEFEVDLATKWQELPRKAKARKTRVSTPDDSEGGDEDEAPTTRSRGHLWRDAKVPNSSLPRGDTVSVTPVIVESSEDEECLYPPW